ncbi:MAG: hypothetical protein ACYDBV_15260 [Nitrospiria bacterium]
MAKNTTPHEVKTHTDGKLPAEKETMKHSPSMPRPIAKVMGKGIDRQNVADRFSQHM